MISLSACILILNLLNIIIIVFVSHLKCCCIFFVILNFFSTANKIANIFCRYLEFEERNAELPINFSDINNLPPLDHYGYLIPEGKYPQILWWGGWNHGHSKHITCDYGSCDITRNKSELLNPLTRGIIIYGTYYKIENYPLPRLPHHEWSLFHEESPFTNWRLSFDTMIW